MPPSASKKRNDSEAGQPFDPWANKSLGRPEKPRGFDYFWAAQSSSFLEQQEELVRSEDARFEERRERGKGRGGGRGRRGFQRYSRPEPRAPRARPSHFVAIRLYSRMIRRNVQQMQHWFLDKNPLFEKCMVPVKRLHSSLLLTSIPKERRGEAQEACQEAGNEIRAFLGDQPIKLTCSGVGSFNGQVLFTRIRTEPHEMLQAIHDALSRAFMRYGFPVLDESAKSWLDDQDEPHSFKAHASFIKVSKAIAHSSDDQKRQYRSLRVTADDIAAWRDVFFGAQLCHEFELLDMIGTTRDGYYPCIQLERFHDHPVGLVGDPKAVHLAAGPLRTGRLRVERGDAGAGMELSVCGAGYLVECLLEWPGQPDLREGDAIVAIGQSLLLDLGAIELEKHFSKAFENDVAVIVGRWETLRALPQELVRRAAERLLRPWQQAERDAVSDDTASLYTQGGTKLSGLRYQLRTTAESFVPDPLSQPGGDPWARAAEDGYVHPAYTGWGTRFKTRAATKVDSASFLSKATVSGPYLDAKGECEQDEGTVVHRRIRKELQGARSYNRVLETVANNRNLLSISNRALAFVRLSSSGWLPADAREDERLRNLLADAQDDFVAIEEAHVSLSPALLSSFALSLGRLGLRRPELFRALSVVVRRVGIWTFADNEVAALLEGLSRSKLSDEVVFQDAARLVVARVKMIAPRLLTTMLTAFACSNISTEHLFFIAGDDVLKRQKQFSFSLLAELADAFSRVRARHALLLELVPALLTKDLLPDKKRCPVESLVKLFSAYADIRQELGPEGLREDLATALCIRKVELSSTLMRQVLQAAARARWPNAKLLEVAAEVAVRDPKAWELEAMNDCFDQLRVLPPVGFPNAPERSQRTVGGEQGRGWRGAAAAPSKDQMAPVVASTGDSAKLDGVVLGCVKETTASCYTDTPGTPQVTTDKTPLRVCRLNIMLGIGAGLELVACEAGYIVGDISEQPGQSGLNVGDVIVAIGSHFLVGLSEDEVEQRFGEGFSDGTQLVVGPLHELEQIPISDVRRCAEELIRPLQEVGRAPPSPRADYSYPPDLVVENMSTLAIDMPHALDTEDPLVSNVDVKSLAPTVQTGLDVPYDAATTPHAFRYETTVLLAYRSMCT